MSIFSRVARTKTASVSAPLLQLVASNRKSKATAATSVAAPPGRDADNNVQIRFKSPGVTGATGSLGDKEPRSRIVRILRRRIPESRRGKRPGVHRLRVSARVAGETWTTNSRAVHLSCDGRAFAQQTLQFDVLAVAAALDPADGHSVCFDVRGVGRTARTTVRRL
jgi:hypothetical protein